LNIQSRYVTLVKTILTACYSNGTRANYATRELEHPWEQKPFTTLAVRKLSLRRRTSLVVKGIKEGQHLGVFAHNIPHPEILAANVLSLGHQWALQKTWRFTPEIDLETYISIQLDYFHTQLLSETGHKELSVPASHQAETTLPDHLSSL
jgi:hypothetical protein